MPIRLCAAPTCPEQATYRGRCADHARQVNAATHRNRSIYNSAKWAATRRKVIFANPLCAVDGCDEIAVDCDHIVPIERGGAVWDLTNLQGLCRPHHAAKTRREQLQFRT